MAGSRAPAIVPRAAAAAVRAAARVFPVVVVTGARQTGKSTLLASAEFAHGRTVISLDESRARAALLADTDAIFQGAGTFVIDEIQREPSLVLALKRAVDAMGVRRERGKFLVTGSANLLLMKNVADSLAGRAGYVTLWPLTRRERLGERAPPLWDRLLSEAPDWWVEVVGASGTARRSDWRDEVVVGGFPEPALQLSGAEDRARWFEGYIDTYLDRDLRDLSSVGSLADFRRFLLATTARIGQVEDQTGIGRDIQVSQQVVRNWLNLLETSYQLVRVRAFTPARGTRVVKSPKLYWSDAALGFHLAGGPSPSGFQFENLVLGDLLAWNDARDRRAEILYWRTRDAFEVDFVVEAREGILGIEVKSSRRVNLGDARGLLELARARPRNYRGGLLLYGGDEVLRLAPGIVAAPWWSVI